MLYELKMVIKNSNNNVFIGEGNLDNKGVYANKTFKKGEEFSNLSAKMSSESEF